MSAVGVYQPGRSVLHRAPAGLKLALLVAAGAGLVLLDSVVALGAALLASLALYAVAGLVDTDGTHAGGPVTRRR